jgi:hypothetical protein
MSRKAQTSLAYMIALAYIQLVENINRILGDTHTPIHTTGLTISKVGGICKTYEASIE